MPLSREALRDQLLDQLDHLIDEIEFARPIAARIPIRVQEDRPRETDLSIKEIYGYLAAADGTAWLPLLHRIVGEDAPRADLPDPHRLAEATDWAAYDLADIFSRVQDARRALTGFLRALPPSEWERAARLETADGEAEWTVYHLAHHVTQDTADHLRAVGYRLHETHLTDRQEDLPK